MVKNELIVSELKKKTNYGNRLLVDKFYESSKKSIVSYFKIMNSEADLIINDTFLKLIIAIDKFEFRSENAFDSHVKKSMFNTARDYLRKRKSDKKEQQDFGIQRILSLDTCLEYTKKDDGEEEVIEPDVSNEDELEKDNNILEDSEGENEYEEDLDYQDLKKELEKMIESEIIPENDNMKKILQTMETFSSDDQVLLRLHLSNIPHKQLTIITGSSVDATRQYVTRLRQEFFKRSAEKFNLNYKEIYEKFKEQNKRPNSQEANRRDAY